MDDITNHMNKVGLDTQDPSKEESKIVDDMIQNLEATHIRDRGNSDALVCKMPIIPIEVMQYYATEYFDDEDFIYQEFTLPECIIDAVQDYQRDINGGEYSMEPYHTQVAQYLIKCYMEHEVTNEHSPIFPILRRIIILFESMIHYYTMVEESGPDYIDANNIYDFVEPGFETMLYTTAEAIENLIQLNPESDEYQTIHQYSKETVYGLGLIIRQIKRILEVYSQTLGIHTIADGIHKQHIVRLFRLTNNMCVIMIFFFLVHDEALESCGDIEDPNETINYDDPASLMAPMQHMQLDNTGRHNADNYVSDNYISDNYISDNYISINGGNWKINNRN